MVVLVEMSTHAAQTGLHTNKKTRTKFKKCLFFTFSFSFFIRVMVIVHDAWETWCLDTSVFCYLEKRYICFFTNVCKPFKTCIILLSTWYGNQCRMLNLLCQAVCCRKKMLYQISTHSQHFKKPIFSLCKGIEDIFVSFSVLWKDYSIFQCSKFLWSW